MMRSVPSSACARWLLLPLVIALVACDDFGRDDAAAVRDGAPSASVAAGSRAGQGMIWSPGTAPVDTIDLRSIGYSRGADDAPVTVYEFSDFGCRFCAMFARGTYPDLHEEFVETGMVRWTYVPFVLGMFPNAAEAALAAECAGEQEEFWEMHDLLYAEQNDWLNSRRPEPLFNQYAVNFELDADRFASCYREGRGGARTAVNNRAADALRVRATPSFLINGRLVEGAPPAEQFRSLLLSLANQG